MYLDNSNGYFKLIDTIVCLNFIPGSMNPSGPNNVVQWVHTGGETITSNIGYRDGRLLVERDGYYYIYSKVTLNAAEECSLIQHKVMKETKAYDRAIELMRSKRFVGATPYFLPLLLHITPRLLVCNLFSLASALVKARRKRSNLHYVLISILCGMCIPVAAVDPHNLQRKNLQVGKTCGTVSWLGSSTCRVGMKSLSHWRI